MPSNNDLAKRLAKLEQRQQQQAAASSEEEHIDYGPHGITTIFAEHDPNIGFGALTKAQQLRVDQVESQLRAEARAARCTQRWSLSITFTEDGGIEVAGPPWWPETPKSESPFRFDAGATLALLSGTCSRRYG